MAKDPNNMADAELSAWLGEVLDNRLHCEACTVSTDTCGRKQYCTDLIPLDDWNVAMKWRDWAVAEYDYQYALALDRVLWQDDKMVAGKMQYIIAQPRHYLIAAAKCKENNNGR